MSRECILESIKDMNKWWNKFLFYGCLLGEKKHLKMNIWKENNVIFCKAKLLFVRMGLELNFFFSLIQFAYIQKNLIHNFFFSFYVFFVSVLPFQSPGTICTKLVTVIQYLDRWLEILFVFLFIYVLNLYAPQFSISDLYYIV